MQPQDPKAYNKRGKFLASSFREAEFWGRPLDESQRVAIANPIIGDERTIERRLLGCQVGSEDMTIEARWALDARLRKAALAQGYDSIVLMTDKAFKEFTRSGRIPRSIELNIFQVAKTLPISR